MTEDVEHFFKCFSAISSIENSLFRPVLYPILKWILWEFNVYFWEAVIYFGNQSSVRCLDGEDLFLFCRLLFCLIDSVLFSYKNGLV